MVFKHSNCNYNKIILIVIFFAISIGCYCQSQKTREIYEEGEEFFNSKDYKEAVFDFLDLIKKGFVNANIQYKLGFCYLNLPGEEAKAIPYLEEAVKNIDAKYKNNIVEKKAPFYSLFYLGNAYRIDNQLDKALETYNEFVRSPLYNENSFNFNFVDNEIKSCQRAKIIQDSPVNVTWINLDTPINTGSSETNPVISGDEKVLVYLESLRFYNAVYISRKLGSSWSIPENINPQIVSDGDFYPTSLSFDGTELYLVKKDDKLGGDIYLSKYSNGKWSPAKRLNDNINSSKDENYASISPNNQVLYFSSNRHGGFGGYDIYRSFRESNGDWGKAENLGKSINTKNDEICPSIAADGKTLYFSSKGHFNMGGYDIFYSTLKHNGTWSDPVNIGFPINTTNDDVGFQVINNGDAGYISRIAKDSKGKEDIYKVLINSKSTISDTLSNRFK